MLAYLEHVEERIEELVRHSSIDDWNSTFVTYEHPHVERLWRQDGENRIYLHRIHPCEVNQAFYHKHPWPSAMRVLQGEYRMKAGVNGETAVDMVLHPGSCYTMTNPNAEHSVRPIGGPTLSIMVTGPIWTPDQPKVKHDHRELTDEEKEQLKSDIWNAYLELWLV